MNLQGNITSIVPTGGYQGQSGHIFTFNMGIQTPQGAYMGQIGSKAEQYPANIGDPIMVEATQDQHGTKFKKINPKFASQHPQGSPAARPPMQPSPQQAYQQNMQQRLKPQTQQQPVSQTDKAIVDWEAKDLRMARMNALTNATSLVTTLAELMNKPEECTPASVKIIAMAFVDFVYGKAPKKPADMTTAELLDTPASVDDIPFGDEGNYEERN